MRRLFVLGILLVIVCILSTIKEKRVYLYLTSDDGPLVWSKNLSEVVNRAQVPVTLFLVGSPVNINHHLKKYLNILKKNKNLLLCNHSFSHAYFHYKKYYKDPKGVEKDFLKNQKFLELNCSFGRLPGRNIWFLKKYQNKIGSNEYKCAKRLYKNGYLIFGWDVEWRYNFRGFKNMSADELYSKIKEEIKENKKRDIVILMHDWSFKSKESKKEFLKFVELVKFDPLLEFKSLKEYRGH
ncbi:MAG: polysaccharide deacetylase family protein [Epsilonproteobacteria bacterium]|nr:polysaccharide deacetylase family protein [Campylobacterota bacterium]